MSLIELEKLVADLMAERAILLEALQPFAEACTRVEQILEDAPPLHLDIFPSEFIDFDENCMWEAARVYKTAIQKVTK